MGIRTLPLLLLSFSSPSFSLLDRFPLPLPVDLRNWSGVVGRFCSSSGAVGVIGFCTLGPVGGSIAIQTSTTVGGGLFAKTCQSVGMARHALGTNAGLGVAGAAAVAAAPG